MDGRWAAAPRSGYRRGSGRRWWRPRSSCWWCPCPRWVAALRAAPPAAVPAGCSLRRTPPPHITDAAAGNRCAMGSRERVLRNESQTLSSQGIAVEAKKAVYAPLGWAPEGTLTDGSRVLLRRSAGVVLGTPARVRSVGLPKRSWKLKGTRSEFIPSSFWRRT